jgi:hypothetical protein
VSRYLVQLARETRSKLRPPSNLRLAPRAPAIYEEIHEERLAPPALAAREFPRAPSPDVVELLQPGRPATPRPERPENTMAPMTPVLKSPEPDPFMPPAREHRVEMTRPAEAAHSTTSAPPSSRPETSKPEQLPAPAATRPVPRPMVPGPAPRGEAQREIGREILETTVRSESFLLDDGRRAIEQPKSSEFAIPEPVRTWLRQEPDRPAPAATRAHSPAPASAPAMEPAVQPVIEVTIGKVEVTIESDSPPPLRAIRRPEARAAAPARPAPALPGRLVRQFLDR